MCGFFAVGLADQAVMQDLFVFGICGGSDNVSCAAFVFKVNQQFVQPLAFRHGFQCPGGVMGVVDMAV